MPALPSGLIYTMSYLIDDREVRWFPPVADVETVRQLLRRDLYCKIMPWRRRLGLANKENGMRI
jgi:hypothetical protein